MALSDVKGLNLGIRKGAIEDGQTCIDCHKGIAHKPVHHLLEKETGAAADKTT